MSEGENENEKELIEEIGQADIGQQDCSSEVADPRAPQLRYIERKKGCRRSLRQPFSFSAGSSRSLSWHPPIIKPKKIVPQVSLSAELFNKEFPDKPFRIQRNPLCPQALCQAARQVAEKIIAR